MNVMKNIVKYVLIALSAILLITAVIFFFLKYPTQEKQKRYDELLVQAKSRYEEKEYAKAIDTLSTAVDTLPNHPEAFELMAKILVDKNQLGQLTEILQKSTGNIDSQSQSNLYSILGEGYLKVGNFEKSKEFYEKAVNLSYANEAGKIGLAKSYLGLGEYAKASGYLDIPTNSSNYPTAYFLKLASTYNDLEKIAEILKEEVKSEDPSFLKQVEDFKAISKVDAKEDLYLSALLGRVYVVNGYSKMAVNLLEPLKEKLMEYQDGVYVLSTAYFNLGEANKTLELLRDYSNPNANPDIYLLEARSYVKTNDIEQAIKKYDQAIVSYGDDAEDAYQEYISFLLNQSQFAKTKEVLDKADKKMNENWIELGYLSMYVMQKNNAKAQFYVDKLAKATNLLDSEKKEYYQFAIDFYLDNQKNNDATILLAKLKEIDIKNPHYYLLNGKLYLQLTNANEAKSNLEKAIDLDLNGEVTSTAKNLLSRVN